MTTFDDKLELGYQRALKFSSAHVTSITNKSAIAEVLKAALFEPETSNMHTVKQKVTYTNWRGETSEREIIPIGIWFGTSEWHPEPQWFIKAIDCEKNTERDFALRDFGQNIHAIVKESLK